MQKIVINKCFGGFGLSIDAIKEYCKLKKWKVEIYYDQSTKDIYLGKKKWEDIDQTTAESKAKLTKAQFDKLAKSRAWFHYDVEGQEDFYDHDIKRDDPDLVKVVKKLGKKANGIHADLEIVEIPDGVKWVIGEYDGREQVEEAHQIWG